MRASCQQQLPYCCCLRGGNYVSSPLFFAFVRGDKINTKSRVADGGFALAWTVAPTVGKRVFLRAVSTIPTVMRCMTPSTATVQKAASGRSKSPAFAGTKTAANWRPVLKPPKAPSQPSPRGGSSFLLCLRWLCGAPSPWGRLGWGFGCGLFSCSFHPDAWGEALKSCKSFCVILPLPFSLF